MSFFPRDHLRYYEVLWNLQVRVPLLETPPSIRCNYFNPPFLGPVGRPKLRDLFVPKLPVFLLPFFESTNDFLKPGLRVILSTLPPTVSPHLPSFPGLFPLYCSALFLFPPCSWCLVKNSFSFQRTQTVKVFPRLFPPGNCLLQSIGSIFLALFF